MERPTGDLEKAAVDIIEVSMEQLSQGCKSNLLELLRECSDRGSLFPVNAKAVSRAKLRLPLAGEDCTPYAAKQRRRSPEEEAHGTLMETQPKCGFGLKTLVAGFGALLLMELLVR